MIVTTLMGGLGNQMFQYAVGRAVALRTGRRLVLDATLLPSPAGGALRPLEVTNLPIAKDVDVLRRPVRNGHDRAASPAAHRVVLGARRLLDPLTIREPDGADLAVDLSSIPRPLAVLSGYWQSHRYFADVAGLVRTELLPRIYPTGRVAKMLRGLEGQDVVTVHVRRGDYVGDPMIARSHGTQPADYYTQAGNLIAEACDDPVLVLLSDDPGWAAEHLTFDAPTVHAELQAPLSAIESLALMSRARHAVIANSTLSWWGAWLAEHPDQLVVAPRRWFRERDIDPAHRFPPAWRLL